MKICISILILLFLSACENNNEMTAGEGMSQEERDYTVEKAVERDGPLLSERRFLNIAHRGASGHAPEHTLVSYQMGEDMNADYIEIDLQMTKDGTLVALHDENISRTSDRKGAVKDFAIDEIKALDVGSWFNEENPDLAQPVFNQIEIPTLEEILDIFGHDANYYIETKSPDIYPGMVEELLDVLHRHDLIGEEIPEGQVIIQSFDKSSLLEVQEQEPSIPLIKLLNYRENEAELSEQEISEMKDYAVGIGVNYTSLTEDFVKKIRQEGLLIHPYTVNKEADMEELINWGATGIFTDYPDRLEKVLRNFDNDKK